MDICVYIQFQKNKHSGSYLHFLNSASSQYSHICINKDINSFLSQLCADDVSLLFQFRSYQCRVVRRAVFTYT